MLIICLIIVTGAICTLTGSYLLDRRKVKAQYESLVDAFDEFFAVKNPDTGSHFNQTMDSIAVLFADRYRIAVSAADRGQIGAAARDVNRSLEEIAVENNPAYAVANSLPKGLKKNPVAMAGLQLLLQRLSAGAAGNPTATGMAIPSNGQVNQVKFDF